LRTRPIVLIRKSGKVRVRRPVVRYDSTQDVRNVRSYMPESNRYTASSVDLFFDFFRSYPLGAQTITSSCAILTGVIAPTATQNRSVD